MTQETQADRKIRHLAVLAELTGLALELARDAAQTALDNPGDPKHKLAFDRLAATIHRLVALEAKIDGPAPGKGNPETKPAPTPPVHNPERARVGRIVRDNLKLAVDGPPLRDVNRYLETRLTQPDVDEAINSTQPIGIIARTICRELSIPFDPAKQPDDVICQRPKQTP